MKKLLTTCLCVILLLGLSAPAFAAADTGFTDVPADSWFAPYVDICADEGLMSGVGGGRFDPAREVSYAECIQLTVQLDRRQKGLTGPLEDPPEGWGTWIVTDENGTVLFDHRDNTGWYSSADQDVFSFPEERVAPLIGKSGTLTVNGETFHGKFIAKTDQTRAGLLLQGLTGTQASSIWDGAYLAKKLQDLPVWARPALYYAQTAPLELAGLELSAAPATRYDFLCALEEVSGLHQMPEINPIDDLPDIPTDSTITYHHDGISTTYGSIGDFYRAGIVTGLDAYGSFCGGKTLSRAECAAMLARVLRPELRVKMDLAPYPYPGSCTLTKLGLTRDGWYHNTGNWHSPDTNEHPIDARLLRVSRQEGDTVDYDADGIMTLDGAWLLPVGRYGEIGDFGADGLAKTATTHYMGTAKYGVIDTFGKEVLPAVYSSVLLGGDGVILAAKERGGDYTALDRSGKVLGTLPASVDDGAREGLVPYRDEAGNIGYLDLTGAVVIPARYEQAGLFYEGLAAVWENETVGFIDKTGKTVIPFQYDPWLLGPYRFRDGAALVSLDGETVMIDASGREITRRYAYLGRRFSLDGLVYYRDENNTTGYVDTRGREYPFPEKAGDYQVMARSGGCYLVCWGIDCYNYMDETGAILSPRWFWEASPMNDEGQAIVLTDSGDYCRLEWKK